MRINAKNESRPCKETSSGGGICSRSPGGQWAHYIRSGPEGAQGVLGYAALSLSISFSSVSLSSIFDL